MSEYISTNVRCADCDNYQDEWCRKIIDSPDPNRPRDCKYYKRAEGLARVIRCKDCKHYKTDHPRANGYHCCYRMHNIFPMKPDDFCSHAERREDGTP